MRSREVLSMAALSIACMAVPYCRAATVAHWGFEEGAVGAVALTPSSILDSANSLNGSPAGSPIYVASTIPGSTLGLRFDGWMDQIVIADDAVLRLTDCVTVEACIRPEGPSADPLGGIVLHRGDSRPGLDPYVLRVRQDLRLEFIINGPDGSEAVLVSPASLATDRLQHVAGTLDDASGVVKLFIEGIEVARAQTSVRPIGILDAASSPGIGIGALSHGGQYFFGRIDEVRISDAALSVNQFVFTPALGDSNGDRVTDGADYTAWADHYLQTTDTGAAVGDFNHDGVVDGADYTVWADNYSLASPILAAVPEPSGFILACICCLAMLARTFVNATSRG